MGLLLCLQVGCGRVCLLGRLGQRRQLLLLFGQLSCFLSRDLSGVVGLNFCRRGIELGVDLLLLLGLLPPLLARPRSLRLLGCQLRLVLRASLRLLTLQLLDLFDAEWFGTGGHLAGGGSRARARQAGGA